MQTCAPQLLFTLSQGPAEPYWSSILHLHWEYSFQFIFQEAHNIERSTLFALYSTIVPKSGFYIVLKLEYNAELIV